MQHALRDSQLLMVEVQASDSPYHFLFEGPPKPETLFVLKEGSHFQGIKDPIIFFGKYCDFDRYFKKKPFCTALKKKIIKKRTKSQCCLDFFFYFE